MSKQLNIVDLGHIAPGQIRGKAEQYKKLVGEKPLVWVLGKFSTKGNEPLFSNGLWIELAPKGFWSVVDGERIPIIIEETYQVKMETPSESCK